MANPYFNAAYYLTNNPDLFAAGINTPEGAWNHYVTYGAAESLASGGRKPAPWFDAKYYLESNPDLSTAGLNPGDLFEHFTNYGLNEGRAPAAGMGVTQDQLKAYAAANEDLREAFGIEDVENISEEQYDQLAQQFYQYGYQENRGGAPFDAGGVDPDAGETFTLTTGVDAIVGTSGNDTVNGVVSATAGETTMSLADTIDGGAGTDTFNLLVSGAGVGMAGSSIKNVENFFIKNLAGSNTAHDFSNVTGAQQIWSDASVTNFAATGIQNNVALGLKNTATNYSATFKDGTFAAGSTVTIAANGAGNQTTKAASTVTVSNAATAGTATDLTLAVAAAGEKNYLEFVNTTGGGAFKIGDVKNISLSGEGFVSLTDGAGGEFDNVTTIDASKNTGGVEVTVGNNSKDLTVTGGSGNDTFVLTNFNGTDKVDGGAGKDTLSISLANALAFTKAAPVTNVEVLKVTGPTAAASTLNADFFGVNNFVIDGAIGHAVTLSNLSNNSTVQINADSTAAGDLTIDVKGAIAGTDDTLTLTTDKDGADLKTKAVNVKAGGVETINIASSSETGAGAFLIDTITDAQLNTINVSGKGDVEVVTVDPAALKTIDASKAEGAVTISALNSTSAVTFSGGAKVDTYVASTKGDTINASKGADDYTLGAGNDVVFYSAADQSKAGSVDTIKGFVTTADLIKFSASLQVGTASFIGDAAFANTGATQVQATVAGGNTTLQLDLDGNGVADMEILLNGVVDFGATNFVFA